MKLEIPWKRYSAETAVIVFSILLAFGVDAWWNRLQQNEYQSELLARMESALTENILLIDDRVEVFSRILETLYSFLEMDVSQADEITSANAVSILRTVVVPNTSTLNNNILLSMFDTGNASLAFSADLQDAIAKWQESSNSLNRRRDLITWHEREVMRAIGKHPEIRPYMMIKSYDVPLGNGGAAAIKAALGDPDIVSLANVKARFWRIYSEDLEDLKQNSESLLSTIRTLNN